MQDEEEEAAADEVEETLACLWQSSFPESTERRKQEVPEKWKTRQLKEGSVVKSCF